MTPIDRIGPVSVAEFEARYVLPSQPVILRGAMDDWPAMQLWSLDYLKARFGDRQVRAARARGGTFYDPQIGLHYESIRFADYVDLLAAGKPIDLFMEFRVHELLPELFDDIVCPPYCRDARWFRSKFWFAGPHTVSALHYDLPHNLYAQILGRKRFVLLDRRCTRMVYRRSLLSGILSGVPNYSPVDAEAPDLARYPRFGDAPRMVADLEPGDLLYIPSLWWHQGHSMDTSASLSLWWVHGPMVAVARAAELLMRVRDLVL